MTSHTQSLSASSRLTSNFTELGTGEIARQADSAPERCQVFQFGDYMEPAAKAPDAHTSIGDLVAQWDANPARRKAMQDARRWVAETFHGEDGNTLRTLRLQKGLSQQQLASIIGSSQPYIARIEGGADSLNIDTCRRLSKALGVDLNTLDQALLQQKARNTAKTSA